MNEIWNAFLTGSIFVIPCILNAVIIFIDYVNRKWVVNKKRGTAGYCIINQNPVSVLVKQKLGTMNISHIRAHIFEARDLFKPTSYTTSWGARGLR